MEKRFSLKSLIRELAYLKADQMHIFDRFFRANNAGNAQGTGLGLNIVQNYVSLMGGEVSFTSEVNKGTTFKIKLPDHLPAN